VITLINVRDFIFSSSWCEGDSRWLAAVSPVRTSVAIASRSTLAKPVAAAAQPQSDNSNGNPLLLLVFETGLKFVPAQIKAQPKKQEEEELQAHGYLSCFNLAGSARTPIA
jgi:hypothetical protein